MKKHYIRKAKPPPKTPMEGESTTLPTTTLIEMKNKQIQPTNKQKGLLMKTTSMVFVAAFCAVVLLGTTSAYAAGTRAGTVIKNFATMTYEDLSGTSFAPLNSDTTSTTVEQVAGISLTPTGRLQYSSDSMYIYFPHMVTNTGNYIDTYNLTALDSASWTPLIFIDDDGDGILDPGETTSGATIASLDEDDSVKVIVRLFVPNGVVSSLLDTIRTTATSTFNNGIDPIVSAWIRDSIRTKVAQVAMTKSNDNATPQPGDVITYTINYTNNGTGTAEGSTVIDTLDNNVTYNSDGIVNSGGGTVSFLTSPNRVVWSNIGNGGDIYGGATGELEFSVTVNAGVPSGTIISNRATMTHTDSISGRTKKPTETPTTSTVGATGAWDIKVEVAGGSTFDVDSKTDSVNVSQVKYYRLRLTNNGNRTDTATFTTSTTIPLSWTFFEDIDSSGTYTVGDVVYSGNTGPIVQGGHRYYVAYDTVGQSVQDRRMDSAKYIASSITLTAKDTGYTYTRIKAPVMTLTKSVGYQSATWGGGNRRRPGDTLIYTIIYTNIGSGTANSIVISDASPTNTTYVDESVEINNSANSSTFTAKTDADNSSDDEVIVSSGTVSVSLGSVGPRLLGDVTHTGQIRFKVKIN